MVVGAALMIELYVTTFMELIIYIHYSNLVDLCKDCVIHDENCKTAWIKGSVHKIKLSLIIGPGEGAINGPLNPLIWFQ